MEDVLGGCQEGMWRVGGWLWRKVTWCVVPSHLPQSRGTARSSSDPWPLPRPVLPPKGTIGSMG